MLKLAKQYIVAFVLLITSIPALAAGPYDGIWTIDEDPDSGYYLVTEKDGRIIVIALNTPSENDPVYSWEAMGGQRIGNFARIDTLVSSTVNVTMDIVAQSTTKFTMELISCESLNPDYFCKFPDGTKFHGTRIW